MEGKVRMYEGEAGKEFEGNMDGASSAVSVIAE